VVGSAGPYAESDRRWPHIMGHKHACTKASQRHAPASHDANCQFSRQISAYGVPRQRLAGRGMLPVILLLFFSPLLLSSAMFSSFWPGCEVQGHIYPPHPPPHSHPHNQPISIRTTSPALFPFSSLAFYSSLSSPGFTTAPITNWTSTNAACILICRLGLFFFFFFSCFPSHPPIQSRLRPLLLGNFFLPSHCAYQFIHPAQKDEERSGRIKPGRRLSSKANCLGTPIARYHKLLNWKLSAPPATAKATESRESALILLRTTLPQVAASLFASFFETNHTYGI
jgi:hypothetical protein